MLVFSHFQFELAIQHPSLEVRSTKTMSLFDKMIMMNSSQGGILLEHQLEL